MSSKCFRSVILAGGIFAVLFQFCGAEDKSPFELTIMPSITSGSEKALKVDGPRKSFEVSLKNRSSSTQRIWAEFCAEGVSNLAFVVTDEAGRTTVSVRKATDWYKKNPKFFYDIKPSQEHVFHVTLRADHDWANSPLPPAGASRKIGLKAVFDVPESEAARADHVWTGRVESAQDLYTLYH